MKKIDTKKQYLKARSQKLKADSGGFIQLIIIVIVAFLLLHFLNISLSSILGKQSVHDFAVYAWGLSKEIWADFLLLLNFIKGIIGGK